MKEAKQLLTEETSKEIFKEWREKAREQTLETLPKFLDHLMNDYGHDYGTICHALSIGSVATMWAMNNHEQGGVTGFQAGAIMWENIQNWETQYRGKPLRLVDYSKMLYPQYRRKFEKIISPNTMDYLTKIAKEKLVDFDGSDDVKLHIEDIAMGHPPFDYRVMEDKQDEGNHIN